MPPLGRVTLCGEGQLGSGPAAPRAWRSHRAPSIPITSPPPGPAHEKSRPGRRPYGRGHAHPGFALRVHDGQRRGRERCSGGRRGRCERGGRRRGRCRRRREARRKGRGEGQERAGEGQFGARARAWRRARRRWWKAPGEGCAEGRFREILEVREAQVASPRPGWPARDSQTAQAAPHFVPSPAPSADAECAEAHSDATGRPDGGSHRSDQRIVLHRGAMIPIRSSFAQRPAGCVCWVIV